MIIAQDLGAGIIVLEMPVFSDDRGDFVKLADQSLNHVRHFEQRQLNYVVNKSRYTCRGLHYQQGSAAESKIFRVLQGIARFVAFGVEPGSDGFRKTFTIQINRAQLALWVPRGFATGYYTIKDNTSVLYSSDNDYSPSAENGLRWNDPQLTIEDLPFKELLISAKDTQWPDFNEA